MRHAARSDIRRRRLGGDLVRLHVLLDELNERPELFLRLGPAFNVPLLEGVGFSASAVREVELLLHEILGSNVDFIAIVLVYIAPRLRAPRRRKATAAERRLAFVVRGTPVDAVGGRVAVNRSASVASLRPHLS